MKSFVLLAIVVSAVLSGPGSFSGQKNAAAEFFRGMYGCAPDLVDRYGAEDVAVSYPIFQQLFDTPAIQGRKKVRAFAERFCTRWKDAEVTIEDSVEEGSTVVLLWSFKATSAMDAEGLPPKGTVRSWGGISLFRFDGDGKVMLEVGEESAPGPAARLRVEQRPPSGPMK